MPKDAGTTSTSAFLDVFCKRSRATPAGEHPKAEETAAEQDGEQSPGDENLSADERHVFDNLSFKPISFDALCEITKMKTSTLSACLITLQMKQLAQNLPGDTWKSTRPKNPTSDEKVLDLLCRHFKVFVCAHFHRISRKYVQPYLA